MCNISPSPPPPPVKITQVGPPNHNPGPLDHPHIYYDHDNLHRWPTISEETNKNSYLSVTDEMGAMAKICIPTALTGLVLYSRSMISMLFLGQLGQLQLAGGSLAIGFANITGYSVLSGLAMGMEPICGQAFGADQHKLLVLTLQRTILLLLSVSLPISLLWLNIYPILVWCGQDHEISAAAQLFITFAIPDLLFLSFLHPIRIYLRSQNITLPVTYCSLLSVLLHVPLNYLLAVHFKMGIAGVSLSMVCTNFNLLLLLLVSFIFFFTYNNNNNNNNKGSSSSWVVVKLSSDCLRGWSDLLKLAIPSCVSVCLEWWWYELMIIMCGLLANPKATVASMGILIQTTALVYVFPSSLSLGVSTRVGNQLGANRPDKARLAVIVGMCCALVVGLAAMGFTMSVRHSWGRLFTTDKDILQLTALALPIAGLCELGNCPQTTGCGVLRGSARPSMGANINLGSFYLVGMPVAILTGFVIGVGFAGLWLGLLSAQASCAVLMLYAIVKMDWLVEVKRARELTTKSSSSSTTVVVVAYDEDNNGISYSDKEDVNKKNTSNLDVILCFSDDDDDDDDEKRGRLETDPLIASYVEV